MEQSSNPFRDVLMIDNLSGHVALVTGGSRGIGKATCYALAARGAAVTVHYRSQAAAAEEIAAQIRGAGGKAIAVQADMIDADAISRMVEQTAAEFGHVDILVNNAGEMTDLSIAEMTDEAWERALTINLTSVMRCTRACLPYMKQRGWGRIINVSSQAAWTGSANHAHYAATKAGILGFTYSLVKELGGSGITANVLSPGRIETDMLGDLSRLNEWMRQTPMRRLGTPDEAAAVIAFLASDAASYVTGSTIHVAGGQLMH
jgi:3-oxoacyl-[acyl-carrier protein] reductase